MNTLQVEFTSEKKYLTLYKKIKSLIISGKLKKEEKLPSKRVLSKEIGVSLNTIMASYSLLEEEGYIYAKEKSGYFVSSFFFHEEKKIQEPIVQRKEKNYLYDFTSERVEETTFPSYTFKKIVDDILLNDPNIVLTKANYQGDLKLRETISSYLLENKAIDVTSQEIVIVSSLEESLKIVDSLINIQRMSIENPGFLKIKSYLSDKIQYEYLDVDKEGMKVKNDNFTLCYVTPYNQFPTGIKMSLKRRSELLSSKVKYIFEDDFDCDLINKNRYTSTLYSLDNNKVFYHGSFSHTLCPGLRISYLVLPKKLVHKYQELYSDTSSRISTFDQAILEKFIKDGYYYRHINKIKKINEKKQEIISNFLDQKDYLTYQKHPLNYLVSINKPIDFKVLKKHLDDALIKIRFIDEFLINQESNILLLSFSSLKTSELEHALLKLFKAIEELF